MCRLDTSGTLGRNQQEDTEGLFITGRPGRGNLGHSGGWQGTEENHTHSSIHLPIQKKPQTRGLDYMDQRINLASQWAELGASFQKICIKEILLKELMIINKGWNSTMHCRLLEERATRIRENKATIQAMQEQLNQTGPTMIPSGSPEEDQPNSPVASQDSGIRILVAKSHNSL
ncbi:hypothetical protein O181_007141 [Austropuccinia psidii MF-1]|uniref:Uncharacterized protein n=1 Tax=Austropuccinia psidii MF-1 TaxID=1389203 RepID=A0A9Q3GHC8_9BASI|nr:hypothetical protein [Austropuccinia psidii MF-1]